MARQIMARTKEAQNSSTDRGSTRVPMDGARCCLASRGQRYATNLNRRRIVLSSQSHHNSGDRLFSSFFFFWREARRRCFHLSIGIGEKSAILSSLIITTEIQLQNYNEVLVSSKISTSLIKNLVNQSISEISEQPLKGVYNIFFY